MIIEKLDRYIQHSDWVDTINSIGIMSIEEIVEYITNITDENRYRLLNMLDNNKRKEVEKLIEGGVI